MNLIQYKEYLNLNNIELFDFDYRVSFHNMKILNNEIKKNLYQKDQTGGGFNYIPPLSILQNSHNKNDAKKLKLIVSNLLTNNYNGAKYLCRSDIKLQYF